jgi:hypothetical protein
MKKVLLFCMLIPVLGISQTKNVVNTNRVFAKADKVLEFEKALANHSQKYHTGDWKWRVFEISSGPDAGGYHITEGPVSWEQLDTRGNLGTEHNNDWNKNVAIFITDRGSSGYSVYDDSISTVAITEYADKINITHIVQKVGYGGKVYEMIKALKPVWKQGGQSVAVYAASSSGPASYAIVTRYKNGLKERADGYRKPLKQLFEAIHGEDSWNDFIEYQRNYVQEQWSELLFMRADLSSK